MRLLTTVDAWRGLGGFGHLAQYTAIRTMLGSSKYRAVMNRFARFKFFAEHACEENADTQAMR